MRSARAGRGDRNSSGSNGRIWRRVGVATCSADVRRGRVTGVGTTCNWRRRGADERKAGAATFEGIVAKFLRRWRLLGETSKLEKNDLWFLKPHVCYNTRVCTQRIVKYPDCFMIDGERKYC